MLLTKIRSKSIDSKKEILEQHLLETEIALNLAEKNKREEETKNIRYKNYLILFQLILTALLIMIGIPFLAKLSTLMEIKTIEIATDGHTKIEFVNVCAKN